MPILFQTEAVGICFLEKLMSRSFEITRGHKSRKKGQISIFFKSRQTTPQNEALELSFSEKGPIYKTTFGIFFNS